MKLGMELSLDYASDRYLLSIVAKIFTLYGIRCYSYLWFFIPFRSRCLFILDRNLLFQVQINFSTQTALVTLPLLNRKST